MGSFSSTTGAISVGFSLCLSLFSFSDVLLRPGKSAGSGKKESMFPLFCSSKHRTVIFLLKPRKGVDLNNGFCVLICVGIYPATWLG